MVHEISVNQTSAYYRYHNNFLFIAVFRIMSKKSMQKQSRTDIYSRHEHELNQTCVPAKKKNTPYFVTTILPSAATVAATQFTCLKH